MKQGMTTANSFKVEVEESMPNKLTWPMIRDVIVVGLAWFFPAWLMAQLPFHSGVKEFVDAFIATEQARLIDRVQRQGNDFDLSRELEKLQKKHQKVFGMPLPAPLLTEFERKARGTPAFTQEQLSRIDSANQRSPIELSPKLFLAYAKVKFMEDIREEGARFDVSRELSKVTERYEKNFGSSMPQDLQDALLRSADSARAVIAAQRAENGSQNDANRLKSMSPRSSSRSQLHKVVNGVGYPDGLPDWFATADGDRDGQVGLYEWDRSRFEEFSKWDLNGDGLLEPSEVLRVDRLAIPPSKSDASPRTFSAGPR